MMYSGTESTTNKEGATIFEVRAWHCVSERRVTMWTEHFMQFGHPRVVIHCIQRYGISCTTGSYPPYP